MSNEPVTTLTASRCQSCGLVATPPEPFGCERCGALPTHADVVEIDPVGTVASFATVHRHHRPEPPTPFTIVAVDLDAGPALKGVFDPDGGPAPVGGQRPPQIGDRVVGAVRDGLIRFRPIIAPSVA